MSDLMWKDGTAYERGERGTIEPRVWQLDLDGLRVVVHRVHGVEPQLWFGSCAAMNIDRVHLDAAEIEAAKAEFLRYLHGRASSWARKLSKVLPAACLIALVGCGPVVAPKPAIDVRLVVDPSAPLTESAIAANTWAEYLKLDVTLARAKPECVRPWWRSTVSCEISIGITVEHGLRERVGSDGAANIAARAIKIDSRILFDRFRLLTVLTHELGHVLLNTEEHTTAGVMAGQDVVLHAEDRALADRVRR